jgi:transposase
MQATVTPQQRQAAKREIVSQMKQGASPHEALVRSIVPMHRTTVYRLLKRVQREEESGFADRRHGHPVKLRGEVLTCLIEHCQANPCVSSSTVQRLLQERFGVSISVSQLNRVRARLGLTRKPVPREKKAQKQALRFPQDTMNKLEGYCYWQQQPRPDCSFNWSRPCQPPLTQLAFLWQAVQRFADACCSRFCFWEPLAYTGRGICVGIPPMVWRCSTSRTRAYSYRYTEAFLSQVARADGAECWTSALACWATQLWHPTRDTGEAEHPSALTCYVDRHRKPVYSEVLIPRGLIGRLGVVLGCRALLLLHDEQGHPLFVTPHRGDQHLTVGVPAFLERYEQHAGNSQVTRMIVDREGMATEFLARLHAQGRSVVTILQTNQYRDLSSFSDMGTFVPLSTDTHGQVVREVAPARISLPREDHPDAPLCLQVALIRDLRRLVLVQPDPEEAEIPPRWDSDLPLEERTWWREGWQATATPAKETMPKLIPIVTTEVSPTIDAIELAQTYIHRWPAQENIIKDYLLPLGLDTNHGFEKRAVENSEVAKRRTHLEQRLARLKQWAQSAGKREAQASRRRKQLRKTFASRSKELYQDLWVYQRTLEEQGVADYVLRRQVKERKAIADAELEQLRSKEWRAYEQCNAEFRKQERYCKEQREVLRALADMKAQEKTMYELDVRPVQLKLAPEARGKLARERTLITDHPM